MRVISKLGAIAISATTSWLAFAAPAEAQTPFLDVVRELAEVAGASTSVAPSELTPRRTTTIARMKATLEEWDRGIDALETRVERELRDARGPRAFQLRIELGLAYRQRGRLEDALRELDAAAVAQPAASDVHLLRALTLEAAGRDSEARRASRTAWLRDAANPVKAYLALRPDSALDDAERERARKVLSDAVHRTLARDQPAGGGTFLVLDPVPDTLSRTPIVGDAAMAGPFTRLAEGRLDEALTAFDASVAGTAGSSGESPLEQFERGRADEIEGRHADARVAYTAALAGTLAGRHALYVGIGRLAQVDGDLDAAIEAFGHAVRLSPNDPLTHRELAGAYAAGGRADDAFAELAAALLLHPRDVDALAAVGQLLLDNDRASEAVTVLRQALELDPDLAEAHYALAMALSRSGRPEEAARQFDRFERLSGQALERRRRAVTGLAGPGEAPRR